MDKEAEELILNFA